MGKEANGFSTADVQGDALPTPGKLASFLLSETVVGENIYRITHSGDRCNAQLKIQILIKKTGIWISPTILGEIKVPCKGHSAKLLNNDRILVVLMGAYVNECTWFLEVDTPYVREQKKILGTEVVAWSRGVSGDSPKPIVVAGPSGVGKGTLIGKLMEEFPSTFGFSVSHTTRQPREKEKNGVHYHFTERSSMEREIEDGKFLEYASVHGNLYGTSIEAVEVVTDSGKRCILDIDVQGSRSVRASPLEAEFIFIMPPSFAELEKRLRGRGTETEEQVHKRLRNAIAEIEQGKSPGLFDHTLVNDDLNVCYTKLKKILALEGKMSNAYKSGSDPKENIVSQLILKSDSEYRLRSETNNWFSLDISLLQGGAPGRTRGIQILLAH